MISFLTSVSGDDFAALAAELEPAMHTVVAETVATIDATMGELIVAQDAVDTGAMLNSRGHEMNTNLSGRAFIGTDHAGFVNWGTVKMPARPFFEPAVDKGDQILGDGFGKLLGG